MIEFAVGGGFVLVGVVVGWYLHDKDLRRDSTVAQETARHLSEALVSLSEKVLVVRGVSPHVAAPGTFTPEGVSYDERDERESREVPAVDSDEPDSEDEAEMRRSLDAMIRAGSTNRASG